jgi:hypothetical protein
MALDSTAREANLKDSVKKYFVDSIFKIEGIQVSFDRTLTAPKVQGTEVDRWVAIIFGQVILDTLSGFSLTIFCCTKKDAEGYKLSQLRDKVIGYLIDTAQTDCMARIPLYRSSASETWELLGAMAAQIDSESQEMEAGDGTKFKTISVRLRWGAKV